MLAVGRLAWHESVRAATSRRWLLSMFVCCAIAYLAADHVAAEMRNTGAAATAWDVHAAAVNSLMYVGYLLFTTFAFMIGDTVAADCESGYAWVVVGRAQGRPSWWLAKLTSVVFVALLLQLLLLAACLAIGLYRVGLPLSTSASQLATLPVDRQGMMLFPEVPVGAHMPLRQLLRSLYLAFAFSGLATALVSLTVRVRKGWLPMTIALVGLMADYVLVRAWEPWQLLSPGARLLEGSHAGSVAGQLSWSGSLAFFGTLLALGALWGGKVLQRTDL